MNAIFFSYKCNACEKSYAQKVGLKIHLEQCQKYLNYQKRTTPNVELDSAKTLDGLLPKYLSKLFDFNCDVVKQIS